MAGLCKFQTGVQQRKSKCFKYCARLCAGTLVLPPRAACRRLCSLLSATSCRRGRSSSSFTAVMNLKLWSGQGRVSGRSAIVRQLRTLVLRAALGAVASRQWPQWQLLGALTSPQRPRGRAQGMSGGVRGGRDGGMMMEALVRGAVVGGSLGRLGEAARSKKGVG